MYLKNNCTKIVDICKFTVPVVAQLRIFHKAPHICPTKRKIVFEKYFSLLFYTLRKTVYGIFVYDVSLTRE